MTTFREKQIHLEIMETMHNKVCVYLNVCIIVRTHQPLQENTCRLIVQVILHTCTDKSGGRGEISPFLLCRLQSISRTRAAGSIIQTGQVAVLLQMLFLGCLWVVLQPAAVKGIWSSHRVACHHFPLHKVDWILHGKTFSLAVSVWHVNLCRAKKICVNKCVCKQMSRLGISSPKDLLSPVHYNLPHFITTPSHAIRIYWVAEEHSGWFHSQCGDAKFTVEQPSYMDPRTGDVRCGAICQEALLCRASVQRLLSLPERMHPSTFMEYSDSLIENYVIHFFLLTKVL